MTFSGRFRTSFGSRCIAQTSNLHSGVLKAITSRWRQNYQIEVTYRFNGVNLNVDCSLISQCLLKDSETDTLSLSLLIIVLHLRMCLFRRQPYLMPFVNHITKFFNGQPIKVNTFCFMSTRVFIFDMFYWIWETIFSKHVLHVHLIKLSMAHQFQSVYHGIYNFIK